MAIIIFPPDALFLDPFRAETRKGEKEKREPFCVVGIVEQSAGIVQIAQYLVRGGIEPSAFHGLYAREPKHIRGHKYKTYAAHEVHYFG